MTPWWTLVFVLTVFGFSLFSSAAYYVGFQDGRRAERWETR